VPAGRPGYVQGLITNTYLSAAEYDLLASLSGEGLSKTRLSVPHWALTSSIHRCTAWFWPKPGSLRTRRHNPSSCPEGRSLRSPMTARFTGGSLARARRHDLLAWLAEYGIKLLQTE
jgi:hypothetical protein